MTIVLDMKSPLVFIIAYMAIKFNIFFRQANSVKISHRTRMIIVVVSMGLFTEFYGMFHVEHFMEMVL